MKATRQWFSFTLRLGVAAVLVPFILTGFIQFPRPEPIALWREKWRRIVLWVKEPLHDSPLLATPDLR
jgi:hypothetical protein